MLACTHVVPRNDSCLPVDDRVVYILYLMARHVAPLLNCFVDLVTFLVLAKYKEEISAHSCPWAPKKPANDQ